MDEQTQPFPGLESLKNHLHTGLDAAKIDFNMLKNIPTLGGKYAFGVGNKTSAVGQGGTTVDGLSFTPKSVFLYVSSYSYNGGYSLGVGDATTNVCMSHYWREGVGSDPGVWGIDKYDDRSIQVLSGGVGGAAVNGTYGIITSINTDGFSILWQVLNEPVNYLWIALG